MADKDTSNEDELDTSADEVETDTDTGAEDEDTDTSEDESDADTESDEGDEDSEDEDSDEEDEDDEDEEPEFKKAFSTIKGDTPEEYIPNLEDAYRKSTREGKKLSSDNKEKQDRLDLINQAVAKDPELAKAIMDATGETAIPPTADPATLKVRQDYEDKVSKDLETFMGEHTELDDDEEVLDEFMENVATVGAASRKNGRIIDPMVAYKKAWAMMDHDTSAEDLATAAKSTASKPKTPKTKKVISTGKPKLTSDQIAYGKKMGLTEKQLLASIESAD